MPSRFINQHGRASWGVRDSTGPRPQGRAGGLGVRDDRTGELLIDASILTPDWFTTGPVAVTASSSALTNVRFDNSRAFICTHLTGVQSGAVSALSLEFTDTAMNSRPWQSRACAFENVTGTAREPYILPAPQLFIPDAQGTGAIMTVRMNNLTGAGVTGEVTFCGFSVPVGALSGAAIDKLRQRLVFFYSGSLAIAAGAGTGTGQLTFVMHDDADSELADFNSDVRTLYDVKLTDQGSRRAFMNANVRAENIVGNGTRPGTFATPLRMGRGSVLVLDAVNRQAGAQTCEVVLAGCKVG